MTSNEKDLFKSIIKDLRYDADELNFNEALKQSFIAYTPLTLPNEVIELLNDIKTNELTHKSSEFDVLLHTLSLYLIKYDNIPPLIGKLPDMTSTTEYFLQLQAIYHNKSLLDRNNYNIILQEVIKSLNYPIISSENIDLFCKNIFNLRKVTTNSILHEYNEFNIEEIENALYDPYSDSEQVSQIHSQINFFIHFVVIFQRFLCVLSVFL